MNIIIAIIVLSVIILVHEFGHFIMAKANGVTVLEFALGFGPKLVHFKKGDTDYSIKLLPFGGACVMLGEDFGVDETDEDEAQAQEKNKSASSAFYDEKIKEKEKALEKGYDMTKAFSNKSVWARISILAAGPLFNFILAFILSVFIIGFLGYDPCTVDKVAPDTSASVAGLMEGDLITQINGRNITFSREYSLYRAFNPDKVMEITYVRDSKEYKTTVTPEYQKNSSYRVGVTITMAGAVNSVVNNSPASKAGLKANDIIKAVDGITLTSGDKLSETLAQTKDKEVTLIVLRDGNELRINITPEFSETESYVTGITSYGERVKTTPLKTLVYSVKEVGYWIRYVIDSLGMMVNGKVSLNDVSGPVGVVNIIGTVVEENKSEGMKMVILSVFNLTVMISANLGVMNLLPLPALDGGRLVFCIIEVLRGKPVSKEKEGMVHFVGMVLLMILMVIVLFNDIKNLFI